MSNWAILSKVFINNHGKHLTVSIIYFNKKQIHVVFIYPHFVMSYSDKIREKRHHHCQESCHDDERLGIKM